MKIKLSIFLILLFPIWALAATKDLHPDASVLFVDLTHPKVLYQEDPNQRLIPASVTKLFVASAALQQLGSTYTFSTPIYVRGTLEHGLLKGDLVLFGMGDPMLINEKLWELANNLYQMGLRQIQGNIIVNNSYLGEIAANDPDRLKAKTNSAEGYNGLLSSAGSNFGTIAVSVVPADKLGQAATFSLVPGNLDNIILSGKVLTSNNHDQPLQLKRESQNNKEVLSISGSVAKQATPIVTYRSAGHPDLLTGHLFKYFLQHNGINVTGSIIIESTPLTAHDQLLTKLQSQALSQTLASMLFYSNNYIADMLTLDLWRLKQPNASSSLDTAAKALLEPYKQFKLHSAFNSAATNSLPNLNSGSGLTPTNQLSANDIVILLDGMYQDTRDFPIFYGSLVVPGQTSEWRHINAAKHPWMNRISVKTGGLSEPVIVYTLAGYFRMNNGDLGAFAILLNSSVGNRGDLEQVLVKKLDAFFEMLDACHPERSEG